MKNEENFATKEEVKQTDRKPRRNSRRRNQGSNKPKDQRDNDYGKDGAKTNDQEWYLANPALSQASANIYFAKPFGTGLKQWDDQTWSAATVNSQLVQRVQSAPGIMALWLAPSFGPAPTANDVTPLSIATQAMYSYVRHANSGSRNYDSPDLMTYVLAMADVYSALNMCRRLYATINRYYPENRYFAKAMVQAQGFDFDSFLGNMAQFAYYINTWISKATAFAVPSKIAFFSRRAMLYEHIYLEGESIKDQIYLFKPAGFYKYTVDNNYDEAYLKYFPLQSDTLTPCNFTRLVSLMNSMIQPLLEAEDIGIVSGDIIKAYGDEIIRLSPMSQDLMIEPKVHDYNILYQIRNCVVTGGYNHPDLHQDASKAYLTWDNNVNFNFEQGALFRKRKEILTSNSPQPTVGEVLESTRLTATVMSYDIDAGGNVTGYLMCGSEVCVMVSVYFFGNSNVASSTYGNFILRSLQISDSNITSNNALILSSFKYHPTFYIVSFDGVTHDIATYNGVFQDLDNVALLDNDELHNLHQTCMMSMLAVPAIAKL